MTPNLPIRVRQLVPVMLLPAFLALAACDELTNGTVRNGSPTRPTNGTTTAPTPPPPIPDGRSVLPIDPVVQQTQLWCWAAVSQMTLEYYGYGTINPVGDYQCGIVSLLGGICSVSCYSCVVGIATTYNLAEALRRYQRLARSFGVGGDAFDPHVTGGLSAERIAREIRGSRPVMAGISTTGRGYSYPPGFGEHVTLIVGYDKDGDAIDLIVNDPFPYAYIGHDPYLSVGAKRLKPGQYLIDYDIFVRLFAYKDTVYFTSS